MDLNKKVYYKTRYLKPSIVKYYFEQIGDDIEKVLDLGCGIGDIGYYKPKKDIEVYGIDIDENAISEAQKYEIAQVLDLDKGRLPFEDNFFDAIIARDVLEHLQKPWLTVNEMYRVLRERGVVIASVPMAKPSIVWSDYTHVRGFTKRAIKDMFEDSGFKIIRVWRMGGVPLTGRLGLVHWISKILMIPVLNWYFGMNWEVKALK